MLKTNAKKARENVRAYILTDADYIRENYGFPTDTATEDETLSFIYRTFCEEERHGIEQNYGNPCFVIFEDWARGLALGGLFLYYYNKPAVDVLGDILEETAEERARYTEQQAEELLTRLIYREIEAAWSREFLKHPTVK